MHSCRRCARAYWPVEARGHRFRLLGPRRALPVRLVLGHVIDRTRGTTSAASTSACSASRAPVGTKLKALKPPTATRAPRRSATLSTGPEMTYSRGSSYCSRAISTLRAQVISSGWRPADSAAARTFARMTDSWSKGRGRERGSNRRLAGPWRREPDHRRCRARWGSGGQVSAPREPLRFGARDPRSYKPVLSTIHG